MAALYIFDNGDDFLFSFAVNVNEQRIIVLTQKCCYLNLRSKVRTKIRWCGKFYYSRISSRLKWYKNYKNRLRLAKVIVKNKLSRFYGSTCISVFNQNCDVTNGPAKQLNTVKKTQNKGYYALKVIQGHRGRYISKLRKPRMRLPSFYSLVINIVNWHPISYRFGDCFLKFKFWTLCVFEPPPLGGA